MNRLPETSRDGGFDFNQIARHPKKVAFGVLLLAQAGTGCTCVDKENTALLVRCHQEFQSGKRQSQRRNLDWSLALRL